LSTSRRAPRWRPLWETFLSNGLHPGMEPSQRKNVRVVNTLIALVVATQASLIPVALFFWDLGAGHFLWTSAIMFGLMGAEFHLTRRRLHGATRVIGAFSGTLNIALSTIVAGTETYVQFLMPAVMIGAFYYFPHEERRTMFALVALSVLSLFALEIVPFEPLMRIPPSSLPAIRLLVTLWFSVITFGFLYYGFRVYRDAEVELGKEREKSEKLLRNILPEEIIDRLKGSRGMIASRFDQATILFTDIVNFTGLSEKLSPDALVGLLDRIFSSFDDIVDRYGVEKIKTIGDAYMVTSGVPRPRVDHCQVMAEVAMEMVQLFVREEGFGHGLRIRVGIQTGPVVAGVIGHQKFAYDIWGDTVNTASRMESHGLAGEIQVTGNVYGILKDEYELVPRGSVEIKGKGPMNVFLLKGRKAAAAPRA
jgi:adenylate cyclase